MANHFLPCKIYLFLSDFSSNQSHVFSLIALSAIIPAFQLGLGVHYEGQCPVDERISTYMIVAGGSGLILAGFCAGVVG